MPWQDRIKEAAYNTPSGNRLLFMYENVSVEFDKHTSAFNYPDADGTSVQDNGKSSRRIPLRLFFTGNDYDIETQTFIDGLSEKGIGKLEHPVYGNVKVVPFGSISRRDDLKTAANQAVLEVTFWETIDLKFPSAQVDPGAAVLTAVEEYNNATSEQFEELLDIDSATEKATFKSRFNTVLNTVRSGLQAVADAQADVKQLFDSIGDSINAGLDLLLNTPSVLAFQTIQLLQTPGRVIGTINARLDAYSNLINTLIVGDDAIFEPSLDSQSSNNFQTNDLMASTAITSIIISAVNTQFATRTEALETAEAILNLSDSVVNWRDANYQSLDEIDTGASYQQYQEAVAIAIGFLVEISFSLKQERRIRLTESRTIIDLVAELYGTVDSELDFFIASNNLSGVEILELPKGKEIVYFV